MNELLSEPTPEQNLMREMGITAADIERRKKMVGLTSDDVAGIVAIKDIVVKNVGRYADGFFAFLADMPEARVLTGNRELLAKTRGLKEEHLSAMVQGNYDAHYVQQRIKLGLIYAKVGLDTRLFLGAFHHVLKSVGAAVIKRYEQTPLEGFEHFMSLKKLAVFDIGLIVDTLVCERERTIRQQQEAIRELSTPVLQVKERLLLLPIIGVIDTLRARLITENLLQGIRANRARVVVMDITGVSTIDSKVANHLLQTVSAARLMGASVIVSGLSSDVAQALVALGIELDKLTTVGDLQGGMDEAERILTSGRNVPASQPTA